jgi:putative hemin transport protein
MDQRVKPAPHEIRRARADNPKARERDLAAELGISEAELIAAHCGEGVVRIEPRVNDLLTGLDAVGEVMALTRNESAVHEKIGVYDKVVSGTHNAMVLGENIDLRIFPKVWAHGFAVEKRDGGDIRRSLQFFDAAGHAVHKVRLRPASNLYAYQKLVASLESSNQEPTVAVTGVAEDDTEAPGAVADISDLRDRWSRLTDVHQFFGMLKALKLSRRQAVRMVGQDYAWLLDDCGSGSCRRRTWRLSCRSRRRNFPRMAWSKAPSASSSLGAATRSGAKTQGSIPWSATEQNTAPEQRSDVAAWILGSALRRYAPCSARG